MSRVTVNLPETLQRQLESLARNEAVSLDQYVVYALTRQAMQAYSVTAVPEEEVGRQRAAFESLLQTLGQASPEEVDRVLASREKVKADDRLSPSVARALKNRISRKRAKLRAPVQEP